MKMGMVSQMDYPYGLRIELDHECLEKLEISKLPGIGDKVNLSCIAEVVSVSSNAEMDGEICNRISLQITDMELVKGSSDKNIAKKIYEE